MPATIFAIANQKGGVGKTTTAINLGAALARRRIPTLIIDLDPQANASSALGFEKTPGQSLYNLLRDGSSSHAELLDKVFETDTPNLFLIPSEVDLAALEIELSQRENYLGQLRHLLLPAAATDDFSAIILDCPPALGMISMNALAAAHYLLITLQTEYLAMEGLGQILEVVKQLSDAGVNKDLELGGILMTMFDVRTNLCNQVVNEVRGHFGDKVFKTVIPRTIRLGEAPSFGKTIFDYDAHSAGATAYKNLGREFAKRFAL